MEARLRRPRGEAPLPAQHAQAKEDARLPRADADRGGARRPARPAAQGAGSAQRVIERIRDRATFALLARGERRRRGPLVVVRAWDLTAPKAPPRVAFRVGRRVGGAVARNRVRRRLREVVRREADRLDVGAAYLVVAGPGAAECSFAELEAALSEALGELARSRS